MRDPIVLCYHAVSERPSSNLAVTPERLDQQLRMLLRLGYQPVTFADAMLRPTAERLFAITFDDAYRSVLTLGLPILQRLAIPATLAVPTGWVGDVRGRAAWPGLEEVADPDETELLTWDEVRQIAGEGWEIAGHTISHPRLTTLDDAELHRELRESRDVLEAQVGVRCETIAYPFGDVDDRVAHAAAAAGYRAGSGLPTMGMIARSDVHTPMRFNRIGIYPVDDRARFAAKLAVTLAASNAGGHAVPEHGTIDGAAPLHPAASPDGAGGDGAGERAPRVAVVIPCFNDGALAREAVASVVEHEPVEVVVVDDASTDEDTHTALAALEASGVRVVRHEVNQGLSAARRTGLAETSAPFVFPLDSDDLLVAGALGRLADRMEAAPDAAAVWGDTVEFGTRERAGRPPARLEGYRVAFRNDYPVASLFRRTALEAVGAWQDVGGMVGYEDWNLWMTLAERGMTGFHVGPGVVTLRRRLHGPRMLGDSITRHRHLYAELRRTHPRLFAQLGRHRRMSDLSPVGRVAYPVLFGSRPPLGLRNGLWAVSDALRRRPRTPGR